MATEDDTFNALRRIPFAQMSELVRQRNILEKKSFTMFMKNHGWTVVEYNRELAKVIRKSLYAKEKSEI